MSIAADFLTIKSWERCPPYRTLDRRRLEWLRDSPPRTPRMRRRKKEEAKILNSRFKTSQNVRILKSMILLYLINFNILNLAF